MSELSYHNSDAVKRRFVSMAQHHRDADMLVAGTYVEESEGTFRGCSVGCFAHEIDPKSTDYHSVVAREAGLPEWLIRLQDRLFEGLPAGEREDFHSALCEAIPVGVNLEPVRHQLAILRMDRLIEQERGNDEVVAVLQLVRDGHQSELDGKEFDWVAARSAAKSAAWGAHSAARRAAHSAAYAARSAARSAVESAYSAAEAAAWRAEAAYSAAESAVESAYSAAKSAARSAYSAAVSAAGSAVSAALSAARSAVGSAVSAALSAAWRAALSAAYRRERDDLLKLLRAAGRQ